MGYGGVRGDNRQEESRLIQKDTYSQLYRTFFPLLIIIAAQGIVSLGVNLADNMMLGAYSELAMTGAAIVNQLQFILQSLTMGVGAGMVALCSQYWGKGETEPIRRVIQLGVKLALVFGIIFWVVTMAFPGQTLRLLTNDEAVVQEGVRYLKLMCWTYLVYSVSSSLAYSLQSVQTAWIGTVMSVSTLTINICLNYTFIYGHFGAPRMGILGSGVATLTSRCIELVIVLIYVFFVDKKLHLRLRELVRFDFGYWRDFRRVSMPIVANGAQWGVAQAAQMSILGHLSETAIAANSIANVIFSIFTIFGMSCANAAQVTIGKTIGEGELGSVKRYAKRLQLIFIVIGVLTGAMVFLFRHAIVNFYSVSDATRMLAVQFLIVLSVTTMGSCYEYPVGNGIISGGGNTKFPMAVDSLFMWVFTLPLSVASAFLFKWSPIVTFCALKSDQILKCLPYAIRVNRFKWIRQVTRQGTQDSESSSSV